MTSPVELTVLNVGHGNAAVVSWTDPITNKPRASMVDAGPSKEFLQDYLKANRIYSISALVISHAHDDHYMGAINILMDEDILIEHVYAPVANKKQDKQWKRFRDGLTSAQSRGAKVDLVVHDGSNLNPRGDPGYLQVLHPFVADAAGGATGHDNPSSLVIRVMDGNNPLALLPADTNIQAFHRILRLKPLDLKAPIFVFPHHAGESTEIDPTKFAQVAVGAVAPEITVFSIGQDTSFPTEACVQRFGSIITEVRKHSYVGCIQLAKPCLTAGFPHADAHWWVESYLGHKNEKCCLGTLKATLDPDGSTTFTPQLTYHKTWVSKNITGALCQIGAPLQVSDATTNI